MSSLLGAIYYDPNFRFPDGETKAKLFIILAESPAGDYIVARTTSNPQRKSRTYGCHNDEPDPNFAIPVTASVFPKDTWISLDYLLDLDVTKFKTRVASKQIEEKGMLPAQMLKDLIDCAASADDTTGKQSRYLRDTLASLP